MIEEYCLGILPAEEVRSLEKKMEEIPELKTAVDEFRQKQSMRNLPDLSGLIWNQIREKVNSIPVTETPQDTGILSRHTKLDSLRKEIGDLTVPQNDENITMVPFRNVLGFEQFLVRVRQFVPEEIHEDLLESFYILEGTCTCFVGEKQHQLTAGGFLEIPMFIPHSVKITSEKPVLAILQRGIIY
ncbi:MAG TPA: cupin domain-containing protein [Catalimonadaceae bacterium]|nr:cupin domain-containing protein [Catalimonadaceae bacterium]